MPKRLFEFIDVLPDSALAINSKGVIEHANAEIIKTFGYEPSEIIGHTIDILLPKDRVLVHHAHVKNYFSAPVKRHMGVEKELFGLHKNGQHIPFEVSLSHFDLDGVSMSMAIIYDISERKKILKELNYSKSLYASLVENSVDHIYQLNKELNIVYINHVSPGLDKDSVIGSNIIDLIYSDKDKKRIKELYLDVLKTGRSIAYKVDFPTPYGIINYSSTAAPVIESGRIVGINIISRDITSDVQTKIKNKKSQRFIEKISRYSMEGIYIYNLQTGKNEFINQRYELISGYSMDELSMMTSEKFFDSVYVEDKQIMLDAIDQLNSLPKGDSVEIEYRFHSKMGDVVFCESVISGFEYNEAGELIKVIGTFIDVTKNKKTEEELKMKSEEFENFAYMASHDLKNPLTSMISGLSLLSEFKDLKPEELNGITTELLNSAHRMNDLIDALLEIVQLDNVRTHEREEIDCGSVLAELKNDLKDLIDRKNATIECNGLPNIVAYKAPFRILLQNLVSNAIKYSKKDVKPIVKIFAESHANYWLFKCMDNGIGINKNHIDKIFEIFHRSPETKKIQGTGIGLASCKKIINMHNGNLWVNSEEGKGSTFYFTISKELQPA